MLRHWPRRCSPLRGARARGTPCLAFVRGYNLKAGHEHDIQTSVTIPATMIWFFPVARMAARISGLSHAFTSPCRLMSGMSGYSFRISAGRGPFGPTTGSVFFADLAGMYLVTLLGRSSHNNGDVEELPQSRMGNHAITVQGSIKVPHQLIQSDLEIQDEKHRIVAIQTLPWHS